MHCRWIKIARRFDLSSSFIQIAWMLVLMDFCSKSVFGARRPSRQNVPRFLPTPTNITVHKGEFAELRCHIKDLGPRMVVWRKASQENPLTIGEKTFTPEKEISVAHEQISTSESKWNLLIKNVQPHHAGVYECAISSIGTYTHYVALNVLSTPVRHKQEVQIFGTEYVNTNSEINLLCNATSAERAPEYVEWFFNGDKIHTSHPHWFGRTEIVNRRPVPGRSYISELIIYRSTIADHGNYVCRSSDLEINSLIVHILNADKKPDIVPRAPGEETESIRSAETSSNGSNGPLVQAHIWTKTLQLLAFIYILLCKT